MRSTHIILYFLLLPLANAAELGGEVFDQAYKAKDSLQVPTAAVYFKEANDKSGNSGFTAASLLTLEGRVEKTLRDHQATESAQLVFERFLAQRKREHDEIIFQCHGADCGDKDGYRAFFSQQLNDDGKHQRYAVTKSAIGYQIIYVVNIDNRPRSFQLVVTQRSPSHEASNIITFATGSSELDEQARLRLQQWHKTLVSQKHFETISVIGYTDEVGLTNDNAKLARSRAETVKRYLIDQLAIPEQRLIVNAVGELARPKSMALGRYVELTLLQ